MPLFIRITYTSSEGVVQPSKMKLQKQHAERRFSKPKTSFLSCFYSNLMINVLFSIFLVYPLHLNILSHRSETKREKGWISWSMCKTWHIHSHRIQLDTNSSYFSFTFNDAISVSCVLWNLCNNETKLHLTPNQTEVSNQLFHT